MNAAHWKTDEHQSMFDSPISCSHFLNVGFQKQRPITSVATTVEPKISQPIKPAIKSAVASSNGEVEIGAKKRKAGATSGKNGSVKRKKATDFF